MIRLSWIGLLVLLSVGALFAQPAIQVSTTQLAMGDVAVGGCLLDTVWAENTGNDTLVLDITVTGDVGPDGFWLSSRAHMVIAPLGRPVRISVAFSPRDTVAYNGTLQILTNCPDSAMQEVDVVLTGTGVPNIPLPQFTLLSPADNATVATGDFSLVWQTLHVAEPVHYTAYLMAPDSTVFTFGPVTDTTCTVPNGTLTEGDWYEWHVVATYGTQSLRSNDHFNLRYGYLPDFDLVSPSNGEQVPAGDVQFTWQTLPVVDSVLYTAHVIRSGESDLTYGPLTDTTCVVPSDSFTNNHVYSWYVVASYGGLTRHSLNTFSFVYAYEPPPPPHVHLIAPADDAGITANTAVFTWSTVTGNPGVRPSYRLRIQAADTAEPRFGQSFSTGPDTSYTVDFTGFSNHTLYVWWVEADTNAQVFRSEEDWNFTLAINEIISGVGDVNGTGLPKQLEIASVYPNPFNPETQIRLLVPTNGVIRAQIFDVLGREVAVLLNAPLSAGEHHLTWRATGSSGIYLLRVSDQHGGVAVQKLTVVR